MGQAARKRGVFGNNEIVVLRPYGLQIQEFPNMSSA